MNEVGHEEGMQKNGAAADDDNECEEGRCNVCRITPSEEYCEHGR